MERDRPWQTDDQLESESQRVRFRIATNPVRPPTPQATYGLLISFGVVYLLEWLVYTTQGDKAFRDIFTIHSIPDPLDWTNRPWSPITATFSHSLFGFMHILFNSFSLYFFGPMIESVLGWKRFFAFFVITGALSSIVQAMLSPGYALGASGGLMAIIGVAIIINPRAKLILFPLPIPIPLWAAGFIFAALDLLGAFSGASGIGNFAHLGGLAIGLAYGFFFVRKEMEKRGLRFATR